MIQFPSLIEWIDDIGLKELHSMHYDIEKTLNEKISFDTFVQKEYNAAKEDWEADMFFKTNLVNSNINEDDDIVLQMAKEVFINIFNQGQSNMDAGFVVTNEDLAPDYESAKIIVDSFHNVLLPAIQKFLDNYGKTN